MISKEALEHIIQQLEGHYYENCGCLENEDLKVVETIENDLNVLDILKKWLKNSTTNSSFSNIIIDLEEVDLDEFYKIREWLRK